jgi:hypothetical protein
MVELLSVSTIFVVEFPGRLPFLVEAVLIRDPVFLRSPLMLSAEPYDNPVMTRMVKERTVLVISDMLTPVMRVSLVHPPVHLHRVVDQDQDDSSICPVLKTMESHGLRVNADAWLGNRARVNIVTESAEMTEQLMPERSST